jgi:hypothetical protein
MQPPELEKPPADTDGSDLYHHRHGVTVSSDAYRQSYEGATSSPWRDPSYLLEYAGERTAEDPDVLETWVTKVFRVVFAGGELDFGAASIAFRPVQSTANVSTAGMPNDSTSGWESTSPRV